METDRRRLSLDLVVAELDNAATLTAIVAAHAIAPSRRLYGMPPPRPGETDALLIGIRATDDERFGDFRVGWDFDPSTAHFDSFVRGYVLFGRLFPHVFGPTEFLDEFLNVPGAAVFDRSPGLASLLWADVAALVGGLYGRPVSRPRNRAIRGSYETLPNPAGFEELRAAQALAADALQVPPAETGDRLYLRLDMGLRAMETAAAFAVDEILRRDVHQRLVWYGDTELAWDIDSDGTRDPKLLELTVDRGVFPAIVPETIAGAVALDLVESLRLDRRTAPCAYCGGPLLMSRSQAGSHARNRPVYHRESCRDEARRRYIRDFQRDRKRARRAP